MWFSRLVNAQRSKTKRVDETTFYALIQYFAIILFECAEAEDYSPAKNLMTLSFTFYHESKYGEWPESGLFKTINYIYFSIIVEVPGCEPYREYLYTYLRDQQIFHTLRFWNAAFFDSLQSERSNKPVPPTVVQSRSMSSNLILNLDEEKASGAFKSNVDKNRNNSLPISDNDYSFSSSSSSTSTIDSSEEISSRSLGLSLNQDKKKKRRASNNMSEILEDKKFQQNITFGQLG